MAKGMHSRGDEEWSPRVFAADADRHYLEASDYALDAESATGDLVEALRALATAADAVRAVVQRAASVASDEADPNLPLALGHLAYARRSLDKKLPKA